MHNATSVVCRMATTRRRIRYHCVVCSNECEKWCISCIDCGCWTHIDCVNFHESVLDVRGIAHAYAARVLSNTQSMHEISACKPRTVQPFLVAVLTFAILVCRRFGNAFCRRFGMSLFWLSPFRLWPFRPGTVKKCLSDLYLSVLIRLTDAIAFSTRSVEKRGNNGNGRCHDELLYTGYDSDLVTIALSKNGCELSRVALTVTILTSNAGKNWYSLYTSHILTSNGQAYIYTTHHQHSTYCIPV